VDLVELGVSVGGVSGLLVEIFDQLIHLSVEAGNFGIASRQVLLQDLHSLSVLLAQRSGNCIFNFND
jgi:hypothetical protein